MDTPLRNVLFWKIKLSDWSDKDTSTSMSTEEEGVGTENANEIRGDDEVIDEVNLEKGVTK